MHGRRSRPAPGRSLAVENLEGRVVMSGVGSAVALTQGVVEVATLSAKKVATATTLAVNAGTLGQPITFHATVRGPASAGSPAGTVDIVDHGQVLATLALSPSTAIGKYAYSQASETLAAQPGGSSYFFGKHAVNATFVPGGSFLKSVASKAFTVGPARYTTLADGVKVATIAPGSGPAIQSGQTAHVLYTGYFPKTGQIFDASIKDGGAPLSFTLGAGNVVPGFDAGTAGMQVGETRLILIPPSQGYGGTANGPIPANSTLLFVQTLESIS